MHKKWTLLRKLAPKICVWSNVSLGRKSAISLKVILNTSVTFTKIWVPNLGTVSNTFPDLNHRDLYGMISNYYLIIALYYNIQTLFALSR